MYLHKHISANNVSIDNFPFQREIAMEAYLIENPTVLSMETEGFNEVDILKCEVTLLDGRTDRNTDGRIDILAKYGQEYLAVVELKLGELTETHLSQLESYLKERNQILQKFPDIWDTTVSSQPKWIGVMIGATINPDLMLKIRKGYYFDIDIPIAALTINRYKGKDGNVYVVTDTYFIERVKNKDYTKYIFNGLKYGKNRLVLAVIKDYVEKNPTITFSQLKSKFPDHLQSRETFTTETEAKTKRDRRNFIEPNELITLADETIAVSTQWGILNINPFIEHSRKMNIDIKIT
ncbi:hypothetical protein [Flavobacterium filum]|uniref:hypothetical protein n=1 Tax=Flavobacterium filum TaxID=370974 RepID=UPI0023F28D6A|nr:hypothetical protein [Flavobacterium filum]